MIEALGGWRSKRVGRVAVGLLCLLLSIGYTVEASGMPFGSRFAPGAGMFPVGVGVAGIVISLIVVIESIARPVVEGEVDLPQGHQRRLVLVFSGATVALVLLLPVLGQYIASSLFATAVLKVLGPHGWVRTSIYGVVTGVAISWIFIEAFGVRLPQGVILGSIF